MKRFAIISIILFPLLSFGQQTYPFSQPVPPNAKLLQLDKHTILIHPLDIANTAHKWTTFDNSLQLVTTKKLVTPDAENIISQTYLESKGAIVRVDQLFIDEQLFVTAYAFDVQGNLLHNRLITKAPLKTSQPIPYHIIQSPDKKYVGLLQTLVLQQDSLQVNSLVIDEELKEMNQADFIVAFDPVVSEIYLPILNNQATLIVPVGDKFDSYKLSTDLNLHVLTAGTNKPQSIPLAFSRLKLRNHYFETAGDSILLSALYSKGNNKTEVAGFLYAGYSLNNQKPIQQQTYTYSSTAQKELKNAFSKEGRKGNLLNYLAPLPNNITNNPAHSFALLMSAHEMSKQQQFRNAPAGPPNIDGVRHDVGHVQGLEGMTLRGSDKPMTFDQASTYAGTVGNTNAGFPVQIHNNINLNEQMKRSTVKKTAQSKNMLFFSFDEQAVNNHFMKLQQPTDPVYSFIAYLPTQNGYSAVYYTFASANNVILQQTTIQADGNVSHKKLMDSSNLLLQADYAHLVSNNRLIGIYEDKFTGQMGLLQIPLD